MAESIISGIVQGITEWLPVSSEGVLVLIKANFFNKDFEIGEAIQYALFLHLGTFFSALVYFRKEVIRISKDVFKYKEISGDRKNLIWFYLLVTVFSGIVALSILKVLEVALGDFKVTGKLVTLGIGVLLILTAVVQFKKRVGLRKEKEVTKKDGVLLGIIQGFSILPGLSRSGLTVAGLLLRRFQDTDALKLSFIMSLPVVLGGNIVLNLDRLVLDLNSLIGFCFSFFLGIVTIHFLLKLTKKVRFAWFVLFFALITIISTLI